MARAHIDIDLRWGDLDAYGHVNNVAYARYLEEVRVRLFWMGSARENTGLERFFRSDQADAPMMLVAGQHIEYVGMLDYSKEPITVEAWIGKVGGSSLQVHCEILDVAAEQRRVVARAVTSIVMVDRHSRKPTRLSDEGRTALLEWTDEPLELRR